MVACEQRLEGHEGYLGEAMGYLEDHSRQRKQHVQHARSMPVILEEQHGGQCG